MIRPVIKKCDNCNDKEVSNNPQEKSKCSICGGKMEIITGEAQATLC